MERRWIDITRPLSVQTPVWPGDPPVRLEAVTQVAEGAAYTLSCLSLSTHAGTHVDPPLHLLAGGADVASLSLEALLGPATVLEVPEGPAVEAGWLAAQSFGVRVLFRTRNSRVDWAKEGGLGEAFVALTGEAARVLVSRGVLLVGVDGPSVDLAQDERLAAHRVLLEAGVVVVEGLDLSQAQAGDWELACLPLRLVGGDGAPARAVLSRAIPSGGEGGAEVSQRGR